MYILDTDTLSLVHADQPKVRAKRDQIDPAEIGTTVVTKIEILRARFNFVLKAADGEQVVRAQQWLRRSEELLENMKIVSFNLKHFRQVPDLKIENWAD